MGESAYPYYRYIDLCRAAAAFLRRHHPSGHIPVPIEQIVDVGLGIDVVPMPGLQDRFETVGFTTGDLRAIYVDEFVYRKRPQRYRFTLAHELGHVILHADFYRARGWETLAEWRKQLQAIPEEQYRFLEWHANAFAGLVLVPEAALGACVADCVKVIERALPRAAREPEAHREFVEACLANRFEVSVEVVSHRLAKRPDVWPPGLRRD